MLFQVILNSVQPLWVYVLLHSLTPTRVIAHCQALGHVYVDVQIRCLPSRTSYSSVPYHPDQSRKHPRSPTRCGRSSRTDPDLLNDSLPVFNICITSLTAVTLGVTSRNISVYLNNLSLELECQTDFLTRTRCIVKICSALARHRLTEGGNPLHLNNRSWRLHSDCSARPSLNSFQSLLSTSHISSFDSVTRPNQNEIFLD